MRRAIPRRAFLATNATDAARYAAAGGLHCTVADYAKFLIAVTAPGPADACRLERDTVAEMVRPVIPVSEEPLRSSWALGWQVLHTDAGDLVAHGGDNAGFHSYAAACQRRRSPARLGIPFAVSPGNVRPNHWELYTVVPTVLLESP
jgi:CubicO group peptidase (beta-lactamase class C family)